MSLSYLVEVTQALLAFTYRGSLADLLATLWHSILFVDLWP